MFGYLPTGPFDLADEDIEGIAIPRTKSRAYKIAVWAGPWGAHQFFLGNSMAGYLHWVVMSTLATFPSWMGFWTGLPLAILLNAGVWLYAIYSMAIMSENDPRLKGHTPPSCGLRRREASTSKNLLGLRDEGSWVIGVTAGAADIEGRGVDLVFLQVEAPALREVRVSDDRSAHTDGVGDSVLHL